jgi:aarF domain-containing kinase
MYLVYVLYDSLTHMLYHYTVDVFVPKIYPDLSTSKVLTMEWVDGARLNDDAKIKAMNLDSSKLIDILVECSLRQMLENGTCYLLYCYTA